jgi:hypothetical protein
MAAHQLPGRRQQIAALAPHYHIDRMAATLPADKPRLLVEHRRLGAVADRLDRLTASHRHLV